MRIPATSRLPSEKLGISVEIYPVTSEGAIIEALRFGTADLAFMDGGAKVGRMEGIWPGRNGT